MGELYVAAEDKNHTGAISCVNDYINSIKKEGNNDFFKIGLPIILSVALVAALAGSACVLYNKRSSFFCKKSPRLLQEESDLSDEVEKKSIKNK